MEEELDTLLQVLLSSKVTFGLKNYIYVLASDVHEVYTKLSSTDLHVNIYTPQSDNLGLILVPVSTDITDLLLDRPDIAIYLSKVGPILPDNLGKTKTIRFSL